MDTCLIFVFIQSSISVPLLSRNCFNLEVLPTIPTAQRSQSRHPPGGCLIQIIVMVTGLAKSKASTIAKLAALPRYRHPMDLLNEPHLPYDLQVQQMNGQAPQKGGQYLSPKHYELMKQSAQLRTSYRKSETPSQRQDIANTHYSLWSRYIRSESKRAELQLSEEQKQRVYQAMHTAKERNEERLSLNRFVKFGYEYSQGFKMDIPLNPVIIMKMVHPHFGYLNNLPTAQEYKLTHEELFKFIEEFAAASYAREQGYTLHSSEMASFIFWKTVTAGKARVPLPRFLQLMKVFKFNLTEDNYESELEFSLQADELKEQDRDVRFDVFRQIFIDRDL